MSAPENPSPTHIETMVATMVQVMTDFGQVQPSLVWTTRIGEADVSITVKWRPEP